MVSHPTMCISMKLARSTPSLTSSPASSPPRRGLLRALADCCRGVGSELEKSKLMLLSSRDGREEHAQMITKPCAGLPEILAMFPTCRPPLSLVLGGLTPLMPRYYSVCSSPLTDASRLSIAFTAVEYTVNQPTNGSGELHTE